jgi:sigma-B regulation protein RsbU (phosphoserine phosphatase)
MPFANGYPCERIRGDYLDFIPLSDGGLGLAVGDASGHGVGAALLIAETRAYVRGHARTHNDPGEILTLVNRDLGEDLSDHHFVTLFFARLDPRRRILGYASAGHCPGCILNAGGVVSATLPSTGMPLGVAPEIPIPGASPVSLAPGDIVLLLTDGITEASADQGPLFGMPRTLEVVRDRRHESPARIAEALFEEARAFAQGTQGDDMTAVLVKVLDESA